MNATTTPAPAPLPTTIPVPPSALVRSLERLGWELLTCEVDVTRETARIELQSFGGRLVTFDARNGRATITREQIETETVLIGRRGDRCRVDRLRTRFLGRQACGFGARSGLRMFANYLTDNSPLRQLPASEVRDSFRLLLGGAR